MASLGLWPGVLGVLGVAAAATANIAAVAESASDDLGVAIDLDLDLFPDIDPDCTRGVIAPDACRIATRLAASLAARIFSIPITITLPEMTPAPAILHIFGGIPSISICHRKSEYHIHVPRHARRTYLRAPIVRRN
jgi:hypothetical protein